MDEKTRESMCLEVFTECWLHLLSDRLRKDGAALVRQGARNPLWDDAWPCGAVLEALRKNCRGDSLGALRRSGFCDLERLRAQGLCDLEPLKESMEKGGLAPWITRYWRRQAPKNG